MDGKGFYLSLTKLDQKDSGKKVRFSTRAFIKSNIDYCAIRFYTFLYGNVNTPATLNVYAQYTSDANSLGSPLITMKTSDIQRWQRVILPIKNNRPFKIVFEGVISSGNQSDIAIDDISVNKACQIYNNNLPSTTTKPTTSKKPTITSSHKPTSTNPTKITTKPTPKTNTTQRPIGNKQPETKGNCKQQLFKK